jgi:hypothetical protein
VRGQYCIERSDVILRALQYNIKHPSAADIMMPRRLPAGEKERRVYKYLRAATLRPEEHPQLAALIVKNESGRLHCRSPADSIDQLCALAERVDALEEKFNDVYHRLVRLEWQNEMLMAVLVKLVSKRRYALV